MKVVKTMLLLSLFLMCIGSLSACSSDLERYKKRLAPSDYGSLKAKKTEQENVRPLETQDHEPKQHKEGSVSYSYELSNIVAGIEGVADSRVFVADGIAYVAVVLDNTGRGMLKAKPSGERDSSSYTPLTAPSSISNNPFRTYLTVNDNTQLSKRFVETINSYVKAQDSTIKTVELSANKEFMYYMDEFAQIIWGNESIDPYLKQFNILVNHQFYDGKVMPTSMKYYRNR